MWSNHPPLPETIVTSSNDSARESLARCGLSSNRWSVERWASRKISEVSMVLFICPNKHSGNFLLLMRGLGEDARVIAARQCPDCGATMRHVATWETLTAH